MAKAKENIVTELTTGIPGWVKGVIWGGVIFGGAYLAYKIYKGAGATLDTLQRNKALKEEEERLKKEGEFPTYSDLEYEQMANALFAALDGYFTESEEQFLPVFMRMKNRMDVIKLIDAFGVRDVSPIYGEADLATQIGRYFTTSEKEEYINGPLRRNGVKYQF